MPARGIVRQGAAGLAASGVSLIAP